MLKSNIEAMNNQALDLIDSGDTQGAKRIFEEVMKIDDQDAESRMMLGAIYAETGDIVKAVDYLQRALELRPNCPDALFYLANIYKSKGEIAQSVDYLVRSIDLDSEFSEARQLLNSIHMNLANSLLHQEKYDQAEACYKTIIRLNSDQAPAWFMLGRAHAQQGQYTNAETCMKEAISINPDFVEAHFVLASFLMMQGLTEKACTHCDRAVELDPDNINAIAMAANIAKRMGDSSKAYNLILPLLEKGTKQINIALAFSMIAKDVNKQEDAINLLEDILHTDDAQASLTRVNLHFNLGLLYDGIKQYEKAFYHYEQGNNLKSIDFDQSQYVSEVERNIAVCTKEFINKLPRSSISSNRPVFIIGMVRSGTSLVEQILSSHPEIYGAGELSKIYQYSKDVVQLISNDLEYPECLKGLTVENVNSLSRQYLDKLEQLSPEARRVTDKLPGNFMYLGLIESLFPNAHIIHCVRDPIDTCLSAYFQDFSSQLDYTYDLTDLACFYNGYSKLMEHWKDVISLPMLEVSYEELVEHQEDVSRKLIKFCGLEWSDDCLHFHKNKRFVRTASYDQVNRPLYNQSIARWKNYKQHLNPLLDALNN